MHCEQPPVFFDRPAFVTPLVTVGEFRCSVNHPRFEDSGPIQQDCFVFPRLAVAIQHEHDHAFVANPITVTFYNTGQVYRRQPISPDGDHCDWFALDRQTVSDVLEDAHVNPAQCSGPFGWSRGPADAFAYLALREVLGTIHKIDDVAPADSAEVEERVILLLDRTVRSAIGCAHQAGTTRYRRTTHDAVYHIEVLLSTRWNKAWQLSDLAQHAGLSVFHLCRAFRAITGRTIHRYRQQLRLRAALDELRLSRRSLVEIALDAGFCSHSHFTSAFRREFKVSPSQLRREAFGR